MGSVGTILGQTQFTAEIEHGGDTVEFVLRKITGKIAAEVLGSKTLGLVRSGKVQEGATPPQAETIKLMEGYLRATMVSPKVADTTDPELDQISIDDLGDWAVKILEVLFEKSGFGELGNLQPPLPDTEGGN